MAEGKKSPAGSTAKEPQSWDSRFLFDVNQQAIQRWTRGMSALSEQTNQFMQARFQEEIGAWNKLTACRNPPQLVEWQREYLEKAAADYLGQAEKLSLIAVEIANDSLAALYGEGEKASRAAARPSV